MSHFFIKLYYYFDAHRKLNLLLLFAFVALIGALASRLQFEEDISQLIPKSEAADISQKVLRQVNFADRIVVYIAAEKDANADDLTTYASQFIDSLETHAQAYIKNIQGKFADKDLQETLDFVYEHLPLFLEEADYSEIASRLDPDSLQQLTQKHYKTLISPAGIIAKKTILKDPLGLSFLGLKKLQQLKIGDDFELHNGFLVSKDHQNLLLFITPKRAPNETDANADFVEKLYTISDQLNGIFAHKVSSAYYGSTVVAVANAQQIKRDIQFTVSIALGILMLILVFFYKKLLIPIILFIPTLFGGLLGIAALFILKTKTSAISLGIGSVLLGITLDYALHILTHYRNNHNIEQLYKDVTLPIIMSSITTAVAFLCLLFIPSEALQDLGVFAAISVLAAAIFALLLIPQLYRIKDTQNSKTNLIDRFASYDFNKSKVLLGICLGLFVLSYFTYSKVVFNQDLASMNFQTESLKNTEQKLDQLLNTTSKSLYVTAYGETVEDALQANEAIFDALKTAKNKDQILNFSSIGSIVLSQKTQATKIADWNKFWTKERNIQLQNDLIQNGQILGFKPTTFQGFYELLNTTFEPISLADYSAVKGLFTSEYIAHKEGLTSLVSSVKVSADNLQTIVDQFAAMPQTVVIDRQHMNETFLGNLKEDFNRLIAYSSIAVFLLLWVFFRRIELALISAIPIALTWLLTLGLMGLLGIEFTIFNIIISTFIFGLGVDYSIFMSNGLIKAYRTGERSLPTYRTSIILSVITTILGVGVLIFAQHPALRSIAVVSIIGILSALLMSFVVQPRLFRFWVSGRAAKAYAPFQWRSFLNSIPLFAFYGFGGMILSVLSFTILPLLPFSKKKKMRALQQFVSKMVTLILYGNPFVKKRIINIQKEDFEKPAIIISNHASALDTLVMGMVTSKFIYLVNDWVYRSPIFGLIARVAGFYPVSQGVDNSLEHLKEKVAQGYSLVVFPEGKRALSNKIGRFHKGAFFLAESLKMDILPFYLHGNSEVLPKGDRIIHDGALTVKIGQRIAWNDPQYGLTYQERHKKITTFYKKEFNILRTELEDADYFKNILLSKYIYKGNDLYQRVKKDFSLRKNLYKKISNSIPFKGQIVHIADDFGQIDQLLGAESLDRRMTTFIADASKRQIAANCFVAVGRHLRYVDTIKALELEKIDVLLISAPLAEETLWLDLKSIAQKIILVKNEDLSA